MSRSRSQPSAPPPPCYALVHPGLEAIAAEEIEGELDGEVKKSGPGIVVFRVPEIDERLLKLRTTEDLFLLAWGSDQLTHRAEDLERIRRWTSREADWPALLRIHHALRPKPKGRPTYHLVAQMEGRHGYLRRDARKALAQGLAGTVPESWRPVEENAAVEFWLTIHGATAVCGLRLSDRTMRHRTYKLEHRPASLRPTIAAALIRLAEIGLRHFVLDPMCGAGTLLAERLAASQQIRGGCAPVWGGDVDFSAVRAAAVNLRRLGPALLAQWDAARLPLASAAVDRIVSNPPFGKQLSSPNAVAALYQAMLREYDRVLRPGGLAVLIVSDAATLRSAARAVAWKAVQQLSIRVLGQPAVITVWRKPES
ncbi:MAG TPA: methyltransferase [Gemmataceae bacterium]|nr:methyltransferase [Gemmataceae bacterium]